MEWFVGYEGYFLLFIIVLGVLSVIIDAKSLEREIKHTIYTDLLKGKTPEQIMPSLNKIIEARGRKERSDSEWLDEIEFVKVQMKEEGKSS